MPQKNNANTFDRLWFSKPFLFHWLLTNCLYWIIVSWYNRAIDYWRADRLRVDGIADVLSRRRPIVKHKRLELDSDRVSPQPHHLNNHSELLLHYSNSTAHWIESYSYINYLFVATIWYFGTDDWQARKPFEQEKRVSLLHWLITDYRILALTSQLCSYHVSTIRRLGILEFEFDLSSLFLGGGSAVSDQGCRWRVNIWLKPRPLRPPNFPTEIDRLEIDS